MYVYQIWYSGWEEHGSVELLHPDLKTTEELEADVLDVVADAARNAHYIIGFNWQMLKLVADELIAQKGYKRLEYVASWSISSNDYVVTDDCFEEHEDDCPMVVKVRERLRAAGIDKEFFNQKREEKNDG